MTRKIVQTLWRGKWPISHGCNDPDIFPLAATDFKTFKLFNLKALASPGVRKVDYTTENAHYSLRWLLRRWASPHACQCTCALVVSNLLTDLKILLDIMKSENTAFSTENANVNIWTLKDLAIPTRYLLAPFMWSCRIIYWIRHLESWLSK